MGQGGLYPHSGSSKQNPPKPNLREIQEIFTKLTSSIYFFKGPRQSEGFGSV